MSIAKIESTVDIYENIIFFNSFETKSMWRKKAAERVEDLELKRIKFMELPTGTVAQLVRATARKADFMGSNHR